MIKLHVCACTNVSNVNDYDIIDGWGYRAYVDQHGMTGSEEQAVCIAKVT